MKKPIAILLAVFLTLSLLGNYVLFQKNIELQKAVKERDIRLAQLQAALDTLESQRPIHLHK